MLPLLALNGPTASGKSSLAIDVALRLKAAGQPSDIVNADSMLVYRGMNIGTAKPSLEERRGVTHHLVDILDVTETSSVADIQARARAAIDQCRNQGILPVVVGGSALYMRAILDVFEFPGSDPEVRARWESELKRVGAYALHGVLAERAPDVASQILPGNGRRIVRALEVLELTGSFTPTLPTWTYHLEGVQSWGLELPRDLMDERIDARVETMWREGLVAEVESLIPAGIRAGRTASLALGYRQVLSFLDGECTEDEAKEATKRGTRKFARKQLSWFRRDERIRWRVAGNDVADEIVASLLASS